MSTESKQLGETLAFQASKYMQSAWKVTGPDKAELAVVVQQDKLDYELFERWIKFLAKPPKNYPYLTAWQEMIKRGGTKDEAKKLGEEFQKTLTGDHVRAARDQGRERDHRSQGAADDQEEKAREFTQRVRHQRRFLSRLRPGAEDACRSRRRICGWMFSCAIWAKETIRSRRRSA